MVRKKTTAVTKTTAVDRRIRIGTKLVRYDDATRRCCFSAQLSMC